MTRGKVDMRKRSGCLRTLDGVIMLSSEGGPAGGSFPENVWLVMGSDEDEIEDFFGPSEDILTSGLLDWTPGEDTHYCVGFDSKQEKMVMNGGGAYPVYVSGLLRMHQRGLQE